MITIARTVTMIDVNKKYVTIKQYDLIHALKELEVPERLCLAVKKSLMGNNKEDSDDSEKTDSEN